MQCNGMNDHGTQLDYLHYLYMGTISEGTDNKCTAWRSLSIQFIIPGPRHGTTDHS